MYPPGTILFCHTHDDDLAREHALLYIKRYGFTPEDVKVARRHGLTIVEARRGIELHERDEYTANNQARMQ